MTGRVVRVAEKARAEVRFRFDGEELAGLEGDSVLTAILHARPSLRRSEFGPEERAGFCLMGACQDCWVWQESGPRIRACSTRLLNGMELRSDAGPWPDGGRA